MSEHDLAVSVTGLLVKVLSALSAFTCLGTVKLMMDMSAVKQRLKDLPCSKNGCSQPKPKS